jgi:exosortase C (VPDSG-CTERM-specific)
MERERMITNSVSAVWREAPRPQRLRSTAYIGYIGMLTLLFVQPLLRLVSYASQHDLYSYIPLVPVIASLLLYVQPPRHQAAARTSILGTVGLASVGAAALAAAFGLGPTISLNDYLALIALAYVSFLAAGGFFFRGGSWMAAASFPIAFLIFLVPMPDALVHWLEQASVLGSADVAAALFTITGTPMLRDGTVLALPGITLQVAQECSGIRSSCVLFITSVLASHLFLKSPWRRLVLAAFVIPLAILRNGFRILVIGLLCVHVGPHMIDSVVHHRGGPIFFVLSLVPLFGLMFWLRHQEQSK